MAKAAAAPADDMTDTASPSDSGDEGDEGMAPPGEGDEGDDEQGHVLLTVMCKDDGTYTLIPGDEDDEGSEPGSGDAEEGAEGGESSEGSEPEGQTFDSPGALLKGILDLIKAHEEGGEGGTQSQFEAGYSGDDAGASAAPTMAQKY